MSTVHAVTSREAPAAVTSLSPQLVPVPAMGEPSLQADAEPIGRLPSEWEQLHDVDIGGDTIETLLIGPNGLFAIHVNPDPRPVAVRPGLGLFRAGTREPEVVKRALRNANALRDRLAHLPGDLFPNAVLVTSAHGQAGHRLGRLLVVRPGRLVEAIWQHVSRPLGRSERSAIREALLEDPITR